MAFSHVFHPVCRRALSLLLVVGLVVAPGLGWSPVRVVEEPSAACCSAESDQNDGPVDRCPDEDPIPCQDCRAGFCLCVGGVFVIDAPVRLAGFAPLPPLRVTLAQLSHPESASLEDIFHPPRA